MYTYVTCIYILHHFITLQLSSVQLRFIILSSFVIVWFYWFSLVYGSDTLLEISTLKYLNTNLKAQLKSESELGVLTMCTAIIRLLINSILPCWVLSLNLLLLKSQMLSKQQTAIRRLCLWHFSGEMQGEHWTFKQWVEKISGAGFSFLNRCIFTFYFKQFSSLKIWWNSLENA